MGKLGKLPMDDGYWWILMDYLQYGFIYGLAMDDWWIRNGWWVTINIIITKYCITDFPPLESIILYLWMIYVTDVVVSGHSFSFWDVPTVRIITNCNLMKRWETWTTRNLVACSLPFLARVMIFRRLPNHVGKTGGCVLGRDYPMPLGGPFRMREAGLAACAKLLKHIETYWNHCRYLMIFLILFVVHCSSLMSRYV